MKDIAQRIADAMNTPIGKAPLRHQRPVDPETDTVLGPLPEHLRNLALLLEEAIDIRNNACSAWSVTAAMLEDADREFDVLSSVFWGAVRAYFPPDQALFRGRLLTTNWEIVGVKKTKEDEAMEHTVQTLRSLHGLFTS